MSTKKDRQRDQMTTSLRNRRETSKPQQPATTPRVKPVRITVDLEPSQHRQLKLWAVHADGASLADIVRILIDRLDSDPALAEHVKTTLAQRHMQ